MTYITLTNDMRLVVTKQSPIYRGDNLNQEIRFLLPTMVESVKTKDSTVFLSYVRPDGTADIVILEPYAEDYNDRYHQYTFPVTCKLSRYPGSVCMWLQFCSGDSSDPVVSKSGECVIQILNSQNMDDCMSDHQLSALYQMKKTLDSISDGGSAGGDSPGDSSGDSSTDDPSNSKSEGYEVVEF